MPKICYDIQTSFEQITDQKKAAKKELRIETIAS